MSSTTSPSNASFSLTLSSLANSGDTDATSRSSTSSDNRSTKPNPKRFVGHHFDNLPWILHRILDCQLSCELPLRIMFSFNSEQKLPNLRQAHDWWQHGEQGRLILNFLSSQDRITPSVDDTPVEKLKNPSCGQAEALNTDHHPCDRFMDEGNAMLLDQVFMAEERKRLQSAGLPPSFVQRFCLEDVFTADYDDADFSQALAGLDYIRDLEVTRRASLREAAQRLGITKENWREVLAADPDAYSWVENMQALEVDISTYYAMIFIDLRIWTMINELQSKPFYKPNAHAMLNTLFPPVVKELPNDKIEISTFHKHRANFYDMILKVEKRGPSVLEYFIEKHLRPGMKHSWPETRTNLELYFERADNMINAATVIHDIRFFRDWTTRYAPPTPSLRQRFYTSESGNTTISSQYSHTKQDSNASSRPTPPSSSIPNFDSSKSRRRIYSRRKISTPAEQDSFFVPFESPWVSQHASRNSDDSEQSFYGRKTSGSITQEADTSSLLSRRTRAESRVTTPLIEQGSEAAQHDSFIRPITPFEDKRREVVARKETIQSRTSSFERSRMSSDTPQMRSLELSRTFSSTVESGSYFYPRQGLGTYKVSSSLARPPLMNDNFEFLKRPYEPEPPAQPLPSTPSQRALKKVSSISDFILRKKNSTASLRINANLDNENAFGIEMGTPRPLRHANSTETFPRFSEDDQPRPRTLRKQKSYGAIERSTTKMGMQSFRSRVASGGSQTAPLASTETFPRFSQDTQSRPRLLRKQASYSSLRSTATKATIQTVRSRAPSTLADMGLSDLAEDKKIKRLLKRRSSIPNLKSEHFYEKAEDGPGGTDHFFFQTGDEYERYRHVSIPREEPVQVLKNEEAKKEVKKTRSFASMRPWGTTAVDAEKPVTVRAQKQSLFRPEPEEGERLKGTMISEPFPIHLQHDPALLAPESRSKEYTRKWFIEEGRARKYDLNPPAGDPVWDNYDEDKAEKETIQLPGIFKWALGLEEKERKEKEFEMPRATPKPLVRPERRRPVGSIFPPRAGEKQRKRVNFAPIDLGKYTKYFEKGTC